MNKKCCKGCNITFDISNFNKHSKYKGTNSKYKGKQYYHNKCKTCMPSKKICIHGKAKYICKRCGGKGICKHDRIKQNCKECSGSRFCEHGKRKYNCIMCTPPLLCEHDKKKRYCTMCSPQNLCEHSKIKYYCKKCCPSILCVHDKRKSHCNKCGGSALCIHCKYILGTNRYVPSLDKKVRCCADCFYYHYPNDKIPRRYKRKQHYFNEKLIEEFGNIFTYDKTINCGCSRKRPDWFLDLYTHSIIIELDEEQHKYNLCNEKRIMELFQDLGLRNLIVIRVNPDKYKIKSTKINGCFKFDKKPDITS